MALIAWTTGIRRFTARSLLVPKTLAKAPLIKAEFPQDIV
jgi:hypothetical protein